MSKAGRKKKKSGKARDGAGPAPTPIPGSRVDPAIARAARDNVVAILGQGRVPARALEIAGSAFFLLDHLTRRLEAAHELPHPIACQAGCDCCCFNQVELTPPEALLLGHYITQNFSPGEQTSLQTRMARYLGLIAGKSKIAIGAMRGELPCPLLVTQQCSVYPVRPLMCRAVHALDATRCEAELRTNSLAGSTYYPHRHDLAASVSAGIRDGCRAVGVQGAPLNLVRALHVFFAGENPVERWLAGDDVFGP